MSQQIFELDVIVTEGQEHKFQFLPTKCKLQAEDPYTITIPSEDPEAEPTTERVFDVIIWLYEEFEGGETIYRRRRTFPFSVREAVTGIDKETFKAILNKEALTPLFDQFGLTII